MSSPSSLDHLVIAGPSLSDLSAWWSDTIGVAAEPGGAHTGRGTRNELAGIDPTTYVELIGPDPDQPDPDGPRPFGIDTLAIRRLVTFAVAVDDVDTACAAVEAAGVNPGEPQSMQRLRPDGTRLSWRLAVPSDAALGGVMPFLIEWGETAHPAADLTSSATVESLRLRHPDAERIVAAIAAATGEHVPVAVGPAHLEATFVAASGRSHTIDSNG